MIFNFFLQILLIKLFIFNFTLLRKSKITREIISYFFTINHSRNIKYL